MYFGCPTWKQFIVTQDAEYLEISLYIQKQVGVPLYLEVIQELNTQPSEYTCKCHTMVEHAYVKP